jgi:hypothetical protein
MSWAGARLLGEHFQELAQNRRSQFILCAVARRNGGSAPADERSEYRIESR